MRTEQECEKASSLSVEELFELQVKLQQCMFESTLPTDSVEDFKYSILALIGELGEVLDADRRWKNVRKGTYNREAKLDELVDCMAFLLNAILYSGYTPEEFVREFKRKNAKNFIRYFKEQEAKKNADSGC